MDADTPDRVRKHSTYITTTASARDSSSGLRSFRLASMFVWRIVQQLQQAALGNDSSQQSEATAATASASA
jgi:hypothetical protein